MESKNIQKPVKSNIRRLFNSIVLIISDIFLFICFTLFVLVLAPSENVSTAMEIISESLAINSFFITFGVGFFVLAIGVVFAGPYISSDKTANDHLEAWLLLRKPNRSLNKVFYQRIFMPINTFNQSFGVGTIGVLIGLSIYQVVLEENPYALVLFLSSLYLLGFVLVSRSLLFIVSMNPIIWSPLFVQDKISGKSIGIFKGLIFLVSMGLASATYYTAIDVINIQQPATETCEIQE